MCHFVGSAIMTHILDKHQCAEKYPANQTSTLLFRPQHPTPGGTPPPGEPPQQVVRGANPGLQLPPRPQAPGGAEQPAGGTSSKAAEGAMEPYKGPFTYDIRTHLSLSHLHYLSVLLYLVLRRF